MELSDNDDFVDGSDAMVGEPYIAQREQYICNWDKVYEKNQTLPDPWAHRKKKPNGMTCGTITLKVR